MATVVNNNLKMVDLPIWEQLQSAPIASSAGACICDDEERFIYYLQSTTNFWRYDSWANTWQQLANPTGGTVGAGTVMRYTKQVGGVFNSVVYGSLFALITNGVATPIFNKYDIATNTWTALSVVGLPATYGTDSAISFPTPYANNNAAGYVGAITVATTGALTGVTTIPVTALAKALPNGTVLNFGTTALPKYAVLTASAAASATSITVSPLLQDIVAENAYYSDNLYLIGNNTTQMYRYALGTNTWSTTADIGGTPALAALSATAGAGANIKWLSGIDTDYLYFFRATASSAMYRYQLSTNTWSTVVYHPATETFTTGTIHALRKDANGKNIGVLTQKDATMRIYEYSPTSARFNPKATQFILATGAAVVGDKICILKSPEGVEFLYFLLHTSAVLTRSPLFF